MPYMEQSWSIWVFCMKNKVQINFSGFELAKMAVCEIPQIFLLAVRKMGEHMCHGAILVQDINCFPPSKSTGKEPSCYFFQQRDIMALRWAFDKG